MHERHIQAGRETVYDWETEDVNFCGLVERNGSCHDSLFHECALDFP